MTDKVGMKTIVYIRGLNTWDSDRLVQGVRKREWMWTPIEQRWQKRGYQFVPLKQLGWGEITEVTTRAKRLFLDQFAGAPDRSLILMAHSTGGLVARLLLNDPDVSRKVRAAVTLATPHRGTPLADHVIDLSQSKRPTYHLSKLVGYDLQRRRLVFSNLTPSFLEQFNQEVSDSNEIPLASLSYGVSSQEMTWPLRALQKLCQPLAEVKSDGIVPTASQVWGEHLGEIPLDHLHQIGFSFPPKTRLPGRKEDLFEQTFEILEGFFNSLPQK